MWTSVSTHVFLVSGEKLKVWRRVNFPGEVGWSPQPLDLTFVNLWKLSCDTSISSSNLKLLQLDQAAWTGTQPEKFSIYLMMEVMVECLGMNWSREKKLFISKGAFGDGGRWKTAGQSSSQSRQPSLPSASLNRWPSPQIRFECKIVRVQGLCRVLVKRYIAQFFKGRSLGNKLN